MSLIPRGFREYHRATRSRSLGVFPKVDRLSRTSRMRTAQSRWRVAIASCCVLGLAVTGCGDDDGSTKPVPPDTLCACWDQDTLQCPWSEYYIEYSDVEPAWSPDGRFLVFSHLSSSGADEVWIVETDGSNRRYLARGLQPDWSPDGARIAFTRLGSGFDIYVMSMLDSTVLRLTHNGTSNYPDWSPTGEQIAFVTGQYGDICVMDPDGQNGRYVCHGLAPDWSPDGSRLAFLGEAVREDGRNDIWVVDADGQNRRPLTSGQCRRFHQPHWAPDGTRIAFTGSEGAEARTSIWLIRPDGTGLCKAVCGGAMEPSWSPDGGAIAYTRFLPGSLPGGCTSTIWISDLGSCDKTQVTFAPAD